MSKKKVKKQKRKVASKKVKVKKTKKVKVKKTKKAKVKKAKRQTGHAPAGTFAFPSKSRCPRCGSTNTHATSTNGDTQYRTCQMPVCRWKYSVKGEKI